MTAEVPYDQRSSERNEHLRPLTTEELRHLGHLTRIAMGRDDLDEMARQHVEMTGASNPNQHGKGLFIGKGDVPMSDENVYRSVDKRAIHDLAESGIVRGAFTATAGERASTSGHATYWNNGENGRAMKLGSDAHFIIEASREAAEKGWVKASDIRGVHARDANGELHDITKL